MDTPAERAAVRAWLLWAHPEAIHEMVSHAPTWEEVVPMDAARPLPTISHSTDAATGDDVWTLRIPRGLTTDVYAVEQLKLRVAAWILRLCANAIEEQGGAAANHA
jgi:hypothetical protein